MERVGRPLSVFTPLPLTSTQRSRSLDLSTAILEIALWDVFLSEPQPQLSQGAEWGSDLTQATQHQHWRHHCVQEPHARQGLGAWSARVGELTLS